MIIEQSVLLTYTELSGGNLCECDQQCHYNRLTGKKQVGEVKVYNGTKVCFNVYQIEWRQSL